MSLHLVPIRHGLVPAVYPPAFRGQLDPKLTAVGLAQAEATRDYLRAAACAARPVLPASRARLAIMAISFVLSDGGRVCECLSPSS